MLVAAWVAVVVVGVLRGTSVGVMTFGLFVAAVDDG